MSYLQNTPTGPFCVAHCKTSEGNVLAYGFGRRSRMAKLESEPAGARTPSSACCRTSSGGYRISCPSISIISPVRFESSLTPLHFKPRRKPLSQPSRVRLVLRGKIVLLVWIFGQVEKLFVSRSSVVRVL